MRAALPLLAAAVLGIAGGCVPATSVPPPTAATTAPSKPPAAASPAAPSVAATSAPAPTTPAAAGAPATSRTAREAAEAGKVVYEQRCQVCHGDAGQGVVGPAVIGPRASPSKFGPTAADWHGYIRVSMPRNAPGSLTPQESLDVTTYLLVENALVGPDQAIDESALRQIKTTR